MILNKIYIIEKNNVPIYVGKTKDNFNVRLFHHRKKYGADVTWFFIDEVEDWKFWEKFYIELFKNWGFILQNKNKGGGGPSYHTDDIKNIIKQKKTGTKYDMTEDGKNNKSEKLSGLKRSNETKQKIKESKTNHSCYLDKSRNEKISKNTPLSKVIIQYDLMGNFIKEFYSANEAGRQIGKNGASIADCAAGRQKSAYGYIWKYK